MPKAAVEDEDETLDLTEDMQIDDTEQAEVEEDDTDTSGDEADTASSADDDASGDEDGATLISFGDAVEDDQEGDSSVIRQLRSELRETKRQLRESAKPEDKIDLGPKPTMAECGYDEEEYEKQLDAWKAKESAANAEKARQSEAQRQVQEEWQADVASFEAKKAKLNLPDIDDAQAAVESTLDLVQQAVMVKAANDPALFMYALSKSPAKMAELAKIKDPIKLGAAIARMEGGIKVVKKRKAPAPDRAQSGSGAMPIDSDKQLEKLEAEAEKTGDRTKLIAYKKKLKAKGK
jgi:hypothetical protein